MCVPCAKYERRYGCVGPCDRPKFKFEGKQYDYCHRFDRGDVGVTCIPRLGGASVLLVCYLRIRKGGGNVPDRESKPGGVYRIAENAGGKRTDCRKMGMRGTFLHGRGMYEGKEKEIIFTIAERKDLPRLKDEVKEIDPNAFISTMHASKDSPRPGM